MPPPDDGPVRSDAPNPGTPGRSLLIVEHSRPVAEVLAAALEGEFERVSVAESLEEVVRLTQDADSGFDVVLCDHTLPDATGQDVRRWLDERTPPGQRRAAFVLMAGSLPGFRRAGSAEMVLLPKPFSIDDLHGAIEEARQVVERGERDNSGG